MEKKPVRQADGSFLYEGTKLFHVRGFGDESEYETEAFRASSARIKAALSQPILCPIHRDSEYICCSEHPNSRPPSARLRAERKLLGFSEEEG